VRRFRPFRPWSASELAGWFFAFIVNTHLGKAGNAGDRVGDAHAYLLSGGELLTFASEVMAAVASDSTAGAALLDP
jgi:hypothetical protein